MQVNSLVDFLCSFEQDFLFLDKPYFQSVFSEYIYMYYMYIIYVGYTGWPRAGCRIGNIIGSSFVYEIPPDMHFRYSKRSSPGVILKFAPARKRSCMSCTCLFAFFQVGNSETCPYLILNMVQVRFLNVIFEKIAKILKLKVSCFKNIVESAAEF